MLAVFAMVYILSFLCVSGFKNNITASSSFEHVHSDDHHADTEARHHQNHKHDDSDNKQKDDNCCSEITASFFTSVQGNSDVQFDFNKTNFTYFTLSFIDKVPHNKISYSLRHFSSQFLKRKIPDIRILIQSFII